MFALLQAILCENIATRQQKTPLSVEHKQENYSYIILVQMKNI